MKKFSLVLIVALLVTFFSVGYVLAAKNGVKGAPEFVPQLAEKDLQKVVFIRYAEGYGKEKPCNNNGVCDAGEKGWCGDCKDTGGTDPVPETSCYDFLSGPKPHWNWIEDYTVNDSGLLSSSNLAVGIWESATSNEIFGQGISGDAPWGIYDQTNTILYGNYDDPNVIGVTKIWFQGKNIYEYDILYDIDYFPGSIDLDTVVLHELGHAAGLGDLYDTVCTTEVMHGIYDGVDMDLGEGDIYGIQTLYGI